MLVSNNLTHIYSSFPKVYGQLASMKVDSIDRYVLTVHNIGLTCEFYSRVLGMQVVTFGE